MTVCRPRPTPASKLTPSYLSPALSLCIEVALPPSLSHGVGCLYPHLLSTPGERGESCNLLALGRNSGLKAPEGLQGGRVVAIGWASQAHLLRVGDMCVQQGRTCFRPAGKRRISYHFTPQICLCLRGGCRSTLAAGTRRSVMGPRGSDTLTRIYGPSKRAPRGAEPVIRGKGLSALVDESGRGRIPPTPSRRPC